METEEKIIRLVKFCCTNRFCGLIYNVSERQKDEPRNYKCPTCSKHSVRLICDNVYQIHPKRRRF